MYNFFQLCVHTHVRTRLDGGGVAGRASAGCLGRAPGSGRHQADIMEAAARDLDLLNIWGCGQGDDSLKLRCVNSAHCHSLHRFHCLWEKRGKYTHQTCHYGFSQTLKPH